MSGDGTSAKVSLAYQQHRPYLIDLAFRMLGEIGAAQDVVQDAFGRLLRSDVEEIEDLRGWLIVVTSRLCLDQISSAGPGARARTTPPGSSSSRSPSPSWRTRPTGSPSTTP